VEDTPPLTLSVWIAGIIARWKLVLGVVLTTLAVCSLAVVVLPPVYQARTSFITPSLKTRLASEAGASDPTMQSAVGATGAAFVSPGYYVKLLESEELRRRVLTSRYPDPRGGSRGDSAALVNIMRIDNASSSRRMEIASLRLSRAMTAHFDLNTNLVTLDVRMPSRELAASVANRITEIVDEFAGEQRSTRARERRILIEGRLGDARSSLATAELEQRAFEDANRSWRTSPDLVTTGGRLAMQARLAEERYLTHQAQLEMARVEETADRARITVVDRAVAPRKAQWPRFGLLLMSALTASALLGLFAGGLVSFATSDRDQAPSRASAVSPRPSFLSRFGFPVFAWGLVFHSLIITALFGWFGLSVDTVRGIAAWKETALVVFLVIVMIRAVTGRGPSTTLAWPDMWIGGLMVTAILFLLTENLWLRFNLPPAAEFLGLRDAVYFMLLYFVGRSMPELASKEKAMRNLFVLIVVTGAIGVVERMVVTPEMLVGLGVASYFQDFLGVSAFTVGNVYGLPLNYWTMIGGHLFRRAGSVYLSGQGFAVPFLLFFPLATAWVFLRPSRTRGQIVAYTIVAASLILTLTRMTILIALIQLVLFVSLRKRPEWAVGGLFIASAVFLAAFALIPGFPTFVWQTLSWQEGSSVSHVNDWVSGLAVFFQNPWGSGLGTADQSAVRSGLKHLTGDNLYLKYGVEMGALGLSLLVLTLIGIGRSGFKLYRHGVTYAQQRMGMTLWLAAIGIAINGITAVVFSSITLGWLFFWLAGATVTVAQTLPRTGARVEPAA